MEQVEGKVALITGAASGMGRAFADRFGAAGAHVVAVDVEGPALDVAVGDMSSAGLSVESHVVDVSSESDMDELAAAVLGAHGQVDLLFNNAGVGGGGQIADMTVSDWQWTLGVNLWGVIHGLRLFLPSMIEQGSGHVINTASIAGHTSHAGMGAYNATKHAVVTISETLLGEMIDGATGVGVSVLCPGLVNTRIIDSSRNRPEHLTAPGIAPEPTAEEEELREVIEAVFSAAKPPAEVADLVFDAVRDDQFWIFTDDNYDAHIAERHASIQSRTNPGRVGTLSETAIE